MATAQSLSWLMLNAKWRRPRRDASDAASRCRTSPQRPDLSRFTSMARQSVQRLSGCNALTVASFAAKRTARRSAIVAEARQYAASRAVKTRSTYLSPNRLRAAETSDTLTTSSPTVRRGRPAGRVADLWRVTASIFEQVQYHLDGSRTAPETSEEWKPDAEKWKCFRKRKAGAF